MGKLLFCALALLAASSFFWGLLLNVPNLLFATIAMLLLWRSILNKAAKGRPSGEASLALIIVFFTNMAGLLISWIITAIFLRSQIAYWLSYIWDLIKQIPVFG